DLERARRIGVAVRDLDQVVARRRDRRAVLDLLDQAILVDGRGVLRHPAAGLQDLVHDLAAEDDLPRDAGAIGVAGRDRASLEQRLDDAALLHEDRRRRAEALRPEESEAEA